MTIQNIIELPTSIRGLFYNIFFISEVAFNIIEFTRCLRSDDIFITITRPSPKFTVIYNFLLMLRSHMVRQKW
jgi:hypothetical protein